MQRTIGILRSFLVEIKFKEADYKKTTIKWKYMVNNSSDKELNYFQKWYKRKNSYKENLKLIYTYVIIEGSVK